jgi:hypothetical protein
MVEARHGGSEGQSVFREVGNGHEAFALAKLWRDASEGGDWKDISRLVRKPTATVGRAELKHSGVFQQSLRHCQTFRELDRLARRGRDSD